QNATFVDHYLEVDYDLSDVMFVATANTMNIPGPLLDRMEVIRLSGYTEDEKTNIALRYLIPKQIEANGLQRNEIEIGEDAVRAIIRHDTRDAGVRRFRFGRAEEKDQIGQVTGLAWTEVGGELLTIEAAVMPGKGKLIHTGKLGDVMQESIQAAMTVVRSRSKAFGLKEDFHQNIDVHIHVPEGATPKDGPSAGIGMCTALVSALTGIPVRADVAMTGEITLRG